MSRVTFSEMFHSAGSATSGMIYSWFDGSMVRSITIGLLVYYIPKWVKYVIEHKSDIYNFIQKHISRDD